MSHLKITFRISNIPGTQLCAMTRGTFNVHVRSIADNSKTRHPACNKFIRSQRYRFLTSSSDSNCFDHRFAVLAAPALSERRVYSGARRIDTRHSACRPDSLSIECRLVSLEADTFVIIPAVFCVKTGHPACKSASVSMRLALCCVRRRLHRDNTFTPDGLKCEAHGGLFLANAALPYSRSFRLCEYFQLWSSFMA